MSDSLYEYFPKQYLILGGLLQQPKTLYENFIKVAKELMFFRVYNPSNLNILVSGDIRATGTSDTTLEYKLNPRGQHLTCFTGGMVGLASKIFSRPDDLAVAEELTQGCIWAYDSNPNGIAPEIYTVMPCPKNSDCNWDETIWHDILKKTHSPSISKTLPDIENIISQQKLYPGFPNFDDRRYILRPEAIESVFIMYRITGKQMYQEAAWRMFQAIEKVSRTEIAAAAIADITVSKEQVGAQRMDSMESFWLAETLKYFYLIFEDFGVVSLDDWVLNTEAHPLRRPGR
jgi:mannosyl-oligosaccharide alpha-1,2-mannosidase